MVSANNENNKKEVFKEEIFECGAERKDESYSL